MGFTLQPAARRDLVDVAVNVDLQQRARMIGWTSGRFQTDGVDGPLTASMCQNGGRRESPIMGAIHERDYNDWAGFGQERFAASRPKDDDCVRKHILCYTHELKARNGP